MPVLTPIARSRTATAVASLPVPAVVGTATTGGGGPGGALPRGRDRLEHGLLCRLHVGAGEHLRLDPELRDGRAHPLGDSGLVHVPVADEECPPDAETPQVVARLLGGAGPEDDRRRLDREDRLAHARLRRRSARGSRRPPPPPPPS